VSLLEQLQLFGLPPAGPVARPRHILIGARIVPYELRQAAGRRLSIRIDERGVRVGAPPRLTFAEIEAFLESVPPEVVVVLDEAYGEYLPEADRCDTVQWLARFPNLLITRTFSKAYGLAGLRVGYGLGQPDVIDLLNRVRHPFNVNLPALAAAEAALDDSEFLARSYALNRAGMAQLTAGLDELGIESVPSKGNFLLARVGDAARVNTELLKRGVIVRPVAAYGLPQFLRVSVGLAGQNARFLEALSVVLADLSEGGSPGAAALEPRPDPGGRRACL